MMKQPKLFKKNLTVLSFLFFMVIVITPFVTYAFNEDPFAGGTPGSDGAEDYSDRTYLPKIRELINSSRKTLEVSLDVMTLEGGFSDPVLQLKDDLIDAAKRGVRVRLFLNTHSSSSAEASLFLRADHLESLSGNGVRIHFVNPQYSLKDRLVIVDGDQVMEGGPPWTAKDLKESFHSSTLIYSVALAAEKRRRLELLPLWDLGMEKDARQGSAVAVPLFLIRDVAFFPAMVKADDGDGLKIYLALLRLFLETQSLQLTVRLEDFTQRIPSDRYFEKGAVQFQVLKAIQRLEREYGLLKIIEENVGVLRVELNLPPQLRPAVEVPVAFFDENYSKDLTPRAHYVYFVILHKSQMSGKSPVWLGSGRNVERDFPMVRQDFEWGVRELRVKNLIEVFPFQLRQGEGYQGVELTEYRYLLNPVISLSEKLKAWERMRDAYGEDPFIRARELAALLGEPEDPAVITTYMDLLSKYEMEDLRVFTQHLETLPPQSTPELLNYLEALLENETQRTVRLATF